MCFSVPSSNLQCCYNFETKFYENVLNLFCSLPDPLPMKKEMEVVEPIAVPMPRLGVQYVS